MQEICVPEFTDGKWVFSLYGDIDAANADIFYSIVAEGYQKTPADVVFDGTSLDFIDSTTLGTFVKILKKVKTDGFTMRLKNLKPKIKKLFLICSLDSVMEIE